MGCVKVFFNDEPCASVKVQLVYQVSEFKFKESCLQKEKIPQQNV